MKNRGLPSSRLRGPPAMLVAPGAFKNRDRLQQRNAQGLPQGMLKHIDQYLHTCFSRESPPRVSELARSLGVPLSKFVETFHRATGMTPSDYLKERQIAAAKLLLLKTKMPVDKVGYAMGFGTRRTFFREFRKRTGVSPAEYRQADEMSLDPSLARMVSSET